MLNRQKIIKKELIIWFIFFNLLTRSINNKSLLSLEFNRNLLTKKFSEESTSKFENSYELANYNFGGN